MATRRAALTTRYLRYYVGATKDGLPYNPTSTTVTFAFMAPGVDPTLSDFKSGSWEVEAGPPSRYVARVLLGPVGTVILTKGAYAVWIKIADNPEVPTEPIDVLTVF
jgi:hypothetical protein